MAVAENEAQRKRLDRRVDAARRLAERRADKAALKAEKRGTTVAEAVEERVEAAQGWYQTNARTLWIALAAGGLIGLVWLSISAHLQKSSSEAADALNAAVETELSPVISADETAPEGVDETYGSVQERAEKAREEYAEVVDQHAGSRAARWARVGDANALYTLGKYAEAQKQYEAALEAGAGEEPYLAWRSLEGLGFTLEAQGKQAEAQARFEELSKVAHGVFAVPGDYHKARMQAAQGKKTEAIATLEALLKAQRERGPEALGPRFEQTLEDAETLATELAVETGTPRTTVSVPSSPHGAGAGGIPEEILEQLRQQLKAQPAEGQGAGEGATPQPGEPGKAEKPAEKPAAQGARPEGAGEQQGDAP